MGTLVWGPLNRANQRYVEHVHQRRATRLVKEVQAEPYSGRFSLLGLPSLYYHRRRSDMIAVFPMLHSGMGLDHATFFKQSAESTTRGHPWKINKPQTMTQIRQNAFSVRVANDRNTLLPTWSVHQHTEHVQSQTGLSLGHIMTQVVVAP